MEGLILTGLAGKLLYDIAGPAAKEIGEMIKDELRPYRAVRQAQVAEKTVHMLQGADIRARAVPPKILLTIFENAGMEEDEDMHTRWAALLANAADSESDALIPPSFPNILGELAPADAKLLDAMVDTVMEKTETALVVMPFDMEIGWYHDIFNVYAEIGFADPTPEPGVMPDKITNPTAYKKYLIDLDRFRVVMLNLQRLGLIKLTKDMSPSHENCYLTSFGHQFIRACQPPRRK